MDGLKIDDALEALCPALSEEEVGLLEASILKDGCRDRIVIWGKTIVDGHNRYRICIKHGVGFSTKEMKFANLDEVKAWMLRNQMGRRNLSESQRGMMAAQLATLGHGQKKADAQICASATQNEAANEAGVSRRTVQTARQVVEHGVPELQKAVTDGKVAVSAAAEVSKLSPKEQKKVVAAGPAAVKSKAKEQREKKAKPKDECPRGGKHERDDGGTCEKCKDPPAKKAGKTKSGISTGPTFDPAELTPSEVKDGHGEEVTGELRHVFAICEEFKEKRQQLTNLKTWITQRLSHPGCALLADAESRVKTDIDNLDSELKFAAPHCACVYCNNKMPKLANCNACKGRGWISLQIYKQAPKDLKRA